MLPLDLIYTSELLVHHHQWLVQLIEQLETRVLDQLIFIEDTIIIDL